MKKTTQKRNKSLKYSFLAVTLIPIIAMTANAFDEDKQHTFDAGMNAHLAKPIEPRMLYDTLAEQFEMQSEREKGRT